MLPRVILHNAVSLDGRIDGFPLDLHQYYELAASWKEDATLAGSDTISEGRKRSASQRMSAPFSRPRLIRATVVPCWPFPTAAGAYVPGITYDPCPTGATLWPCVSESTPQEYLDYLKERHIDYIIAGQDHVDLRVALDELNSRFGVKVVRVDAGGTLNGQLLRQGLVNEVSLLISPSLVGGEKQSSIFRAPDLPAIAAIATTTATDPVTGPQSVISLKLLHMERLKGEVIWLRYEVK